MVGLLASLFGAELMGRSVGYMRAARWRAGPFGQPVPRPPDRLPSPDPIVRLGTSPAQARARRAAQLRRR